MAGSRKRIGPPKPIRVGVVGVGRGQTFMHEAAAAGMKLVAICDTWKERLDNVGARYGITTYQDYDKFLEHDMHAVVLANYFHEHAPLAIKALRAGKHVMSECAACNTLAEGVELCRTVEKTRKIYLFAENYPYTASAIEMKRQYTKGEIGQVLYAEGEYNHPGPFDWYMSISPGVRHWRNRMPVTYYCTHSIAPLMAITNTMPVTVSGFAVPVPDDYPKPLLKHGGDMAGIIMCRMDNGAIFRLLQTGLPGHSIWYRLHGTWGLMETVRGPGYWGPGAIRVVHDEWDIRKDQVPEKVYFPQFPRWARAAATAEHGGGDFFTNRYFAEAMRAGEQPYLNVYRGVAMSCVGILAWKSVLAGGAPFRVPDFTRESSRKAYSNDRWTPFALDDPKRPPTASRGEPTIDPKGLAQARKVWKGIGYLGQ